jgi:hypothetical protein
MTKSLSAMTPKSVVAQSLPTHTFVGHQFVEPWLRHGGLAQVDLVDDGLSDVDPGYRPAAISQHGTDHRADLAEADNYDPRPLATDHQVDLSVATPERAFTHRPNQPFGPPCAFCQITRAPRLTRPAV